MMCGLWENRLNGAEHKMVNGLGNIILIINCCKNNKFMIKKSKCYQHKSKQIQNVEMSIII